MAAEQTISQINGIDLDALRRTVGAIEENPQLAKFKFRAASKWISGTESQCAVTDFFGANQEVPHQQTFEVRADEPPLLCGHDRSPGPGEYLLSALASCITTGVVAHAAVRGIHIEELESQVEGDVDLRGFLGLDENVSKGFTHIRVKFQVKAEPHELDRLRKLVDFSPVLATITDGARVDVQFDAKG